MSVTEWNAPALLRNVHSAWNKVNLEDFPKDARAEIADPKWAWPRQTKRQSGETVGSPRDIVDTGRLIDSYKYSKSSSATHIHYWDVPYSALVVTGATLKNGTVLPPRDFTEEPLNRLVEHMERHYDNG